MNSESSSLTIESIESNEMLHSNSPALNDSSSIPSDGSFRRLREYSSGEDGPLNDSSSGKKNLNIFSNDVSYSSLYL